LEQLENKIVNAASNFVQPALRSVMLGNQLRFSYVNVLGFNVRLHWERVASKNA
jgi:hypothetical protein